VTVFTCAGCGAELTVPLSRVALPVHCRQQYDHELLGVLMEPGTYAVDPEPFGPPWRPWSEIEDPEGLGLYAPVFAVSDGPRGSVVVAPGDVRGMVFLSRPDGYCIGLDGRDGPNLACERCGRPVATRMDDCSRWQAVWLDPRSVSSVASAFRPVGWEALLAERPGLPPVEPAGYWSPVWEAAVGAALARVLAVSRGSRVTVPDGLIADTFGRVLDSFLPSGPSARSLAVVGPGLPPVTADIFLVPEHPQTGVSWSVPGEADAVPLAWDVWAYLALHRELPPFRIPDDVRRDDPQPLMPHRPFRPEPGLLLSTLARLPEVRQPWLRQIYDRVTSGRFTHPF
jgi:hypothetical protein